MTNILDIILNFVLFGSVLYIFVKNQLRAALKFGMLLLLAATACRLVGYGFHFFAGETLVAMRNMFFRPGEIFNMSGTLLIMWSYRNTIMHMRKHK